MGASDNKLHVMEARCSHEHTSIARLRNLPRPIFDLVVRRIAKGDVLTPIAKYLHDIQPGIADETFRKWLQPLATQVRALLAEEAPIDEVATRIESTNAAIPPLALGRPPGPSAGSVKRLKAVVKRACQDISSEIMLRYAWALQHKRVDKMIDLETRLGVVLPGLHKEIDTLRGIAESLVKFDVGKNLMKNKAYEIREMAPPEPGSLAEKVSKLDQVDRNLILAAWGHVMDIFEDKALELQAEQDRKKNAANPENEDHHQLPRYKTSPHLPAIKVSRYRRRHRLLTINVARYGRNQHLSALNVRKYARTIRPERSRTCSK